ncbi:amino acid adenylation domain-containing protein [Streptomyces sp. NA02950]|uniref:non-ribosomal peptide synthetase n=1 Tax=Streptomyces sp. NA02950 TaxID=2742137 RepID=UPI0015901450|nr:non-ribosomal peptide synthetase [Streptomyces sp. NA02950]QKV97136.1 amino acid adenylation domain-containing protein [Streptomyces sp. NA02950]
MNTSASTVEFLAGLRRRGITVTADGDDLRCTAPRTVLTAELRAEIVAHKSEILRELRAAEAIPVFDGTPPLSFGQERLWLMHRLHPGSSAYHSPLHLRLSGVLIVPALRTALRQLVRRHAVLRTQYPVVDGAPTAEVCPAAAPELPLVDLSGRPVPEATAASRRIAAALTARPFDLETGPVIRAVLVRRGPEDHDLVLVRHHIATDGWSLGVLLSDLVELYRAHAAGTRADLAPLPVQYGDYAAWQRQRARAPDFGARLARWTTALDGAPARLDLLGRAPGTESGRPAASAPARVDAALTEQLRALATRRRTTLFPVLLTAFALALGSLSGQRELVVGAPVAGRTRRELDHLAGCFVNLLPLRVNLSGASGFAGLLDRVAAVVRQGLEDQEVPFERIVDALRPDRSLADTPLVQAAVAYQNTPASRIALPGLTAAVLPSPPVTAKFPLTLTVSPGDGDLELELEFEQGRVHPATAAQVLARTVAALEAAGTAPDLPLSWNRWTPAALSDAPAAVAVGTGCLHLEFERIAAERPDAVAISDDRAQISYRQLDTRADRLAAVLVGRGVGRESLVGLCVAPSIDLVVGMLAILKAGAAYVPMDPADPPRRRAELATEAGLSLVVTERTVLHSPELRTEVVFLDPLGHDPLGHRGAARSARQQVHPDNLAYVVFTSGSTGGPKGVLVSHRNIVSVLSGCRAALPELGGGQHTWAMLHSPAFDFSAWEIWGALTSGARLVIVPPGVVRAPDELWQTVSTEQVSVLSQTPSAFRALLPTALRSRLVRTPLAAIVLGGESCEVAKLAPWFDRCGVRTPALVNMFGITETTVHVTARHLRPADVDGPVASPLGQAVPGQRVDVLDKDGNPQLAGGQGEIAVSGAGLTRGYLGRPGLTADRYRPAPQHPSARRYHSGDLARVLPGDLDYLGRGDEQLSLRGYRVEPGEVEAAVLTHPGVLDCLVVPQGTGDRLQLVAYLVAEPEAAATDLSTAAVRAFLSAMLPRHLVPARTLVVERLPLTRNGKLDERALPVPPPDRPHGRPVESPTERTVADLVAEVLGWPSATAIGAHDNFFDLGGDSLLVTRFHFRLVTVFGIDLSVRTVYQAPDLAALAVTVERLRAVRHRDLVREALELAENATVPGEESG